MEIADFRKKLGQQIVKLRKKKGWSQAELARNCYKDRQAIERVENGKVNATAFYLHQIAKALGVKTRDLLDFEE